MATTTPAQDAASASERDLLARLGLGSGASDEQIEQAHEAIVAFLDRAPASLRGWAARHVAIADEAYALLEAGPAAVSTRPAATAKALPEPPVANVPRPSGPTAPSRRARAGRQGRRAAPLDALDDVDEWEDEPRTPAAAARKESAAGGHPSASQRRLAGRPSPRPGISPAIRRAAIVLAGAVAVVGVAFGGYSLGAPAATPAPSAAAGADEAAFQQQVAGLMQKLAANPSDVAALVALGNLYYQAQDYASAQSWMQKVLAIDPKHVDGLLAYGAASFNLSEYETAETAWKQVLALEPDNVEAYYDLGFLYFSDSPPEIDRVREMWGKVVELAPDTAIAKTVGSHLKSLDSLASGAPAASPASAGDGAPLASPAPAGSPGLGSPAPASAPPASPGPG
jgi:cytochrome c-type biogenesis protein CcmH/NrfG